MTTERITVTLPKELVAAVDQLERNRSRFVSQAVEHELERRRREALLESVRHPHEESLELVEAGFDSWAGGMHEDDHALLTGDGGVVMVWVEGVGWSEAPS